MNGMESLNNTVGAAINAYAAHENTTHNTSGKTIGQPKLSEKAQKYYDELKSKYQSLDFVLVSKDMKEMAKANASSFANPNKMVVLIDEEKIERMAEDEQFRKKYEGIIASAGTKLPELKQALGNTSGVKGFGMQVNDDGSTSFFAVMQKSFDAQAEHIEKIRAEKKEEKDAETPAIEQLERSTRRMVKIAETGESIQKELKNVVDRMKLDLEDLKGAAVDETLQVTDDSVEYGEYEGDTMAKNEKTRELTKAEQQRKEYFEAESEQKETQTHLPPLFG